MKTLLISSDYPPMVSGIATACYNFWRYLPKERVVALAPKLKGYEKYDSQAGIKTYRYRPAFCGISKLSRLLRMLLLKRYAKKIIKKEEVKMIHAGQPVIVGLVSRLLSKKYGIPYVIYVYGGEVRKFKGGIFFKTFLKNLKEAEAVIVNSNYTASEIKEFIPEKEIKTVYPGVNTETFIPAINTGEITQRYGLNGKTVLLTVARLVQRKGQHLVIEALNKLKNDYPDLVYLVAGGGPEKKNLVNLADKYGLSERLIFTGEIAEEELPALYNACDIFIMLSTLTDNEEVVEGFGISFMEANSCGKPVIGGKTGGVVEAVKDGETGFLADPENIDEVSGKIRKLLEDGQLRKQFGEKGRKRAREEFEWKKLSRLFLEYLA